MIACLKNRKLVLLGLFFCTLQMLYGKSKNDNLKTIFLIDFRSMHIWRGMATSYMPTIEPSFVMNTNNTTSGIWFAQSIDGKYTELDLYFIYSFSNFSFAIYDYYCPPNIQTSNEIANFNKYSTKHTIELNLAFN